MFSKFIFTLFVSFVCMRALFAEQNCYLDKKDTFLQLSTSAILKNDPEVPGQYVLTIRGLSPKVLYVINTSVHVGKSVTLSQFLAHIFKESTPCYLSFKRTFNSDLTTSPLNLSHPIYDRSTNSITFTAKPQNSTSLKTGRFKNTVLLYELNADKNFITGYKVNNSPLLQDIQR